jgi:4a-hydroxytetrahydrobiopterin dehydratase
MGLIRSKERYSVPDASGRLSADEVRTALDSLSGWSGGAEHLYRDVDVDADSQDELEAAVMTVANELNHHPEIERRDDGMRFVLWSHDAGGVTSRDVELAARIDQVLSGPRSTAN